MRQWDFEVFRPRFGLQYNSNTLQRKMEGPFSEGASQAAQRDEAFSNLSTKPNISEQNEYGQPEALVPQSQSVEGKAEDFFDHLPEAERQSPYRSQSVDQGNPTSSNHSSALQHPNQSRQLQQQAQQPTGLIVSSSGKTYQLKTFGEDWENDLKKQEEERERYHQLINTNNQPLLSQKEEHQSEFRRDQLILSQKGGKQSKGFREVDQLSNEVKLENLKGKGLEIEEVSEHPSSQSSKEEDQSCQPLFEMMINDESQSNLLDFGFKVQSQRRSNRGNNRASHQQNTNQQPQQQSAPAVAEEVPMDIVQEKSQSKKSEPSQHIQIRVSNCQMQNSTTKNNDIYGITQLRKEDSQVKKYEESILIKNQNPFRKEQQPMDIQQNFKEPLSLQEIVEEMASILKKDLTQQQKAYQGFQLLKDHIDLYFLKPLSGTGASIMKDGKSLINLVQIILLKETDPEKQVVLKKYLILTLAKYLSTNVDDFIDYQQAALKKNPYSNQFFNEGSVGKNLNDTLNQTNLTVNEVDESNYAENGSHDNSIHKSPNYMVDAMNEEPVKRTVVTRNFLANTERRPTPKSGKVTRKRYKSKTKGKASKTSSKKTHVQFQIPEENEEEVPARYTRSRGRPKSGTKELGSQRKDQGTNRQRSGKKQLEMLQQDQVAKQVDKKEFGSKFTFIQRENRRDSEKQLVQVRLSQRLAQKQDRSPTSGRRYSSSKIYEDQPIDLDYIKKHLPQFKIVYEQMDKDYAAYTPRDKEILQMLKEYFRLQQQMEEEERNQQRSQEGGENTGEVDEYSTISMNDTQSNTRARLEEFKKNLEKYKPSDFTLPISVAKVIDPDINNHGIYALLELGRISQFILKAKYALAPITALSAKLRKLIDQDLASAKSMVGEERDNLAYLQPTPKILELIRQQKEKRQQ